MQIVCKSVFTKMFKMSTICKDTYLETLSSLVNCSVNNDLSEIGPYRKSAVKHSLSLLRTVNEVKAKCRYFLHGVNLYVYFQNIWQKSVG